MISEAEKAVWRKMFEAACAIHGNRVISPFIEAGCVSAAIESSSGKIYTGVCIDTACGLGMCAERSALVSMISSGESHVRKVLCIMPDGRSGGTPCGACREYMMQLDRDSGDIEILLDLDVGRTVRLRELIPDWWGYDRFNA